MGRYHLLLLMGLEPHRICPLPLFHPLTQPVLTVSAVLIVLCANLLVQEALVRLWVQLLLEQSANQSPVTVQIQSA
jgi:hypothetical protein